MSIYATIFGLDDDGHEPPLVYQGSHVVPDSDDPRGGALLVCAIPDHCHPAARWGDGEGRPVEFLRLSTFEAPTTFQGRELGQATLVLDLAQVVLLRDTLTHWIDSRGVEAEATAVPEEEL